MKNRSNYNSKNNGNGFGFNATAKTSPTTMDIIDQFCSSMDNSAAIAHHNKKNRGKHTYNHKKNK